jgi:hypothetical protein
MAESVKFLLLATPQTPNLTASESPQGVGILPRAKQLQRDSPRSRSTLIADFGPAPVRAMDSSRASD